MGGGGGVYIISPWKENHPKKQGFFLYAEPLKSLGKKGKTLKKARKFFATKKQGNPKKQGKEDQGMEPFVLLALHDPLGLVAHDCGYPLSRYTCRATRVAAGFLDFIAFCRCSTGVALHPLKILVSHLAPPPAVPGGVAPKFGSEKVSRYTGVSQLQLRVSRYTVQLSPIVESIFGQFKPKFTTCPFRPPKPKTAHFRVNGPFPLLNDAFPLLNGPFPRMP